MLSENLKTLRKKNGMSQETLAQQLNVVRQTISKWEKGLSVPDADMLTRIADLFEVPVSKLLGSKIDEEKNTDEVAMQLAILNEQLANRSRRNRKIAKIVLGSVLAVVVAIVVIYILAIILFFSVKTSKGTRTTTQLIGTIGDEEYIYVITYDEQYRIIEAGGDAFIGDHVQTEQYSDANVLMAQIEDYFWERGGTCERLEE